MFKFILKGVNVTSLGQVSKISKTVKYILHLIVFLFVFTKHNLKQKIIFIIIISLIIEFHHLDIPQHTKYCYLFLLFLFLNLKLFMLKLNENTTLTTKTRPLSSHIALISTDNDKNVLFFVYFNNKTEKKMKLIISQTNVRIEQHNATLAVARRVIAHELNVSGHPIDIPSYPSNAA